jgi:hypothetical protein
LEWIERGARSRLPASLLSTVAENSDDRRQILAILIKLALLQLSAESDLQRFGTNCAKLLMAR